MNINEKEEDTNNTMLHINKNEDTYNKNYTLIRRSSIQINIIRRKLQI